MGLPATSTVSKDKKWYTKVVCLGCSMSDQACSPVVASDLRCCCFDAGMKVDPIDLKKAQDTCDCQHGNLKEPSYAKTDSPTPRQKVAEATRSNRAPVRPYMQCCECCYLIVCLDVPVMRALRSILR